MVNSLSPSGFMPVPELAANVYYVVFPEAWRDALYELEKLRGRGNYEYYLPTARLEKLILSWLPGVVSCKPINRGTDLTKWLVAGEPVRLDILAELIKDWVYMEYAKFDKANPEFIRQRNWLMEEIDRNELEATEEKAWLLFTGDGQVAGDETFSIFPLVVVRRLVGQELELKGQRLKLLYAGRNELITEPARLWADDFKGDKHYYSFLIQFSVQTTPPDRKVMLVYKCRVRRWVSTKSSPWDFKKEFTKAYLKTAPDRLHPLYFRFNFPSRSFIWDRGEDKYFGFLGQGKQLPELKRVIEAPEQYISEDEGSLVITYRYGLGSQTRHPVAPGLPMNDQLSIHEFLQEKLEGLVRPAEPAVRIQKRLPKVNTKIEDMDKAVFRERMAQGIGTNELAIEVYCHDDAEIGQMVYETIKEQFDAGDGVTDFPELRLHLYMKPLGSIGDPLDEGPHQRIRQIKETYGQAEVHPTACIVVLPGAGDFEAGSDPKSAIRRGFAETGRLSQFITPEPGLDESGLETPSARENRVKSAIYDLYRQLGFLLPWEKSKLTKVDCRIPVLGIRTVKKSKLGEFPVVVKTDYEAGRVTVSCDCFNNEELLYWQACLALAQLEKKDNNHYQDRTSLQVALARKVHSLDYTAREPLLLLVQAENVRHLWKFINDKSLSQVERSLGEYTLSNLFVEPKEPKTAIVLAKGHLRIIRVRGNEEVPDYLTGRTNKGTAASISGLFRFGRVYWGIAAPPRDRLFRNSREVTSKVLKPGKECKRPDMIEFYPVHLQPDDDPAEWVYLAHKHRELAYQYKDTLRMPLPLHLAGKLEEYLE